MNLAELHIQALFDGIHFILLPFYVKLAHRKGVLCHLSVTAKDALITQIQQTVVTASACISV